MQSLANFAVNLISSLGYAGIAIGTLVNAMGIPIPSEVLLPLAGAAARQGRFSLLAVITVSVIAQLIGTAIAYWLGRRGGLPLIQRYGKYVFFKERELEITQNLFQRWGQWLVLFGRCIPVVTSYISYPAAVAGMPFGRFMLASGLGFIGWSTLLTVLGYELFGQIDRIHAIFQKFGLFILVLLIIGLIWYLKFHRDSKNNQTK